MRTNQAAAYLRPLCLCLFDILSAHLVNDPFVNALIIFRGKDWLLFTANGLVSLCSYCFCTQPTACLSARRPWRRWLSWRLHVHVIMVNWLTDCRLWGIHFFFGGGEGVVLMSKIWFASGLLPPPTLTGEPQQWKVPAHNHSVIYFTAFEDLLRFGREKTALIAFGFRSMSLTLSGAHLFHRWACECVTPCYC